MDTLAQTSCTGAQEAPEIKLFEGLVDKSRAIQSRAAVRKLLLFPDFPDLVKFGTQLTAQQVQAWQENLAAKVDQLEEFAALYIEDNCDLVFPWMLCKIKKEHPRHDLFFGDEDKHLELKQRLEAALHWTEVNEEFDSKGYRDVRHNRERLSVSIQSGDFGLSLKQIHWFSRYGKQSVLWRQQAALLLRANPDLLRES